MKFARCERKYEVTTGSYRDERNDTITSVIFPAMLSLNKSSITNELIDEFTVLSGEEVLEDVPDGWDKTLFQQNVWPITLKNLDTGETQTVSADLNVLSGTGSYNITYKYSYSRVVGGANQYGELILIYTFSVVVNRLPLKKWTVTDVINRIFDTVTPLFDNEKPQFRLKGVIYDDNGNPVGVEPLSTADKLEKILAPEMTFTKMTLREMLKQVGGFIHGEPRITAINYENGRRWYEIDFDFYGGFEYSNISKRKYVSATLRTDINEFCTSLDSSADNIVNRLDWASGVIIEPFVKGKKSLRTEMTTVRMEEDNSTFISTDLPIDTIYKLEYVAGNTVVDITPYLFESADYKNLSSYDGTYPYCKAYAIYYTYGQKNIKGLFFKAPHAVSSIFHQYAIRNIITSVNPTATFPDNYAKMSFRVTYLPIYSERIRTNKQTIVSGIPRTLAYNQGANLIETRYYGENLKGVIARLGNVEKTYTYNVAFLSDIPKVGTLFDDNYYISAVATEILPSYIRVTISLSKDFNRLSQYVGISSEKRMWEISERQAFNRDTVISNTIVVSEKADYEFPNSNSIFSPDFVSGIAKALFGILPNTGFVSVANVYRYRKDEELIGKNIPISLPVLSIAMGNSMLFTIRFEDSYSAGQKSVFTTGNQNVANNNVTGYWGAYVPYGDYYGRIYYLMVELISGEVFGTSDASDESLNFPNVKLIGSNYITNKKIKYRKDSREIPAITVEINTVTDDPSIIIGSALAKNCSLVNRNPQEYELWLSVNRINTISSTVDFSYSSLFGGFTINDNNIVLPVISNFDKAYKSWAIVTRRKEIEIQVEDDNGNTITQTIYEGGELVLGGNNSLKNGKTLYFHLGRDVYD
jgi:hypothetical protein